MNYLLGGPSFRPHPRRVSSQWQSTDTEDRGDSIVLRNSPVQFKVVDDVLVVQHQPAAVEPEDERNVASARSVILSDGARLGELLQNSNLDPKLREVFDRQVSIAASGADVIQLGLVNIESRAMLASVEDELMPTDLTSLHSFCKKTEMYVGQFPEWKRFVGNARALPSLAEEVPMLTEIVEDLSVALQGNSADVDLAVPRTIDFVVSFARNPRGSLAASGLALVGLLENIVVAVADYCGDLLKGIAQVASKKLQGVLGVGVAVAVTSALTSYLGVAERLGLSPWIAPALGVLKRFIAAASAMH